MTMDAGWERKKNMKVTEFPGLSNQNEKGMLREKMYGSRQ